MSGISRRLKHHLRAHERLHWHLDYLLPHGKVSAVVAVETGCRIECYLATALARRFRVIDRFGSSDCRCSGHLLQGLTRGAMIDAMSEAARAAGCSPSVTVLPLRGRPPA
jgi:Uri superfamily endonuclease